jgi:hypothetical protein
MNDLEKAYMDDYAASFFPPETPEQDLPEVFPMRAGAMLGEMKAIEQTGLQRIMEQTGLTLEQVGEAVEGLGSVNIGGFKISLRDLLPFVGGSVQETDPATGEVTERTTGTPAALQQMGQGVSATTGTGVARQLRPDMKEAVFDVLELGAITKAGSVVGKKAVKKAAESLDPIAGEIARDTELMFKEVGEAMTKRRAQGAK